MVSRSKPVDSKQLQHMQPAVMVQRSITASCQLPLASTELFLQLEAATAVEPEQEACSSGVSKSPCTSGSITAADTDIHLGSQEASCTQLPLVSESVQQLEALQDNQQQVQQQVQQQQAITGAEQDVYAGFERGSGLQTEARPSGQSSNAAMSSTQQAAAISADVAQVGDADTVQHASEFESLGQWNQLNSRYSHPEQVGSSSQQAQASSRPQLGLSGNAHHQGQSRLQPRALSPAVTPKAAEAPLRKQGSYAVAARQARHRSERHRNETQQLAAHKAHMRTATASKQPAQVALVLGAHSN